MAAPRKTRLSRDDWERAALDAIAEGGISAVAVEPLAAALGVTKGSFYAHFPSRDALIEATLTRWERSHSESLGELDEIADPAERLERVMLAAISFSPRHNRKGDLVIDERQNEGVGVVTGLVIPPDMPFDKTEFFGGRRKTFPA